LDLERAGKLLLLFAEKLTPQFAQPPDDSAGEAIQRDGDAGMRGRVPD